MKSLLLVLSCVALATSMYTPPTKWLKSEDGSTYYIDSEQKYNWYHALHECARKNMSLIAIDTYNKHKQIDTLLRTTIPTGSEFWIGGHDMAVDNRYEWVSTGEVFGFTNWGPSQPGRSTNEHCIVIFSSFTWYDENCSTSSNGFICEENQLLKGSTQELEFTKNNNENPSNDSSKTNNFIFYVNGK